MNKIFIILVILLFSSNVFAAVGNPTGGDNTNLKALGVSFSKKIKLIEGLSSFDKSADAIFIAPHIFYDNFDSESELDSAYGFGFNLGYNYKKFDVFSSIGFLRSSFEYEVNNEIKDLDRNALFYGVGAAYNFNKYIGLYLSGKYFEIEFTDSAENEVDFGNSSLTFGLSFNM